MSTIAEIQEHFSSHDPIIATVIQGMNLQPLRKKDSSTYFSSLCETIISQQLAGKAADAIISRFRTLFPQAVITPAYAQTLTPEMIRAIGASWAKARSIADLTRRVTEHQLDLETLDQLDDGALIEALVTVKGIGPWTAEMFMIFTMARENIFSRGDLGLRKGIQKLYKDAPPDIDSWSPYRSYASLALWHALDNR